MQVTVVRFAQGVGQGRFAQQFLAQKKGNEQRKHAQKQNRQQDGNRNFTPGRQALLLVVAHAQQYRKNRQVPQGKNSARPVTPGVDHGAYPLGRCGQLLAAQLHGAGTQVVFTVRPARQQGAILQVERNGSNKVELGAVIHRLKTRQIDLGHRDASKLSVCRLQRTGHAHRPAPGTRMAQRSVHGHALGATDAKCREVSRRVGRAGICVWCAGRVDQPTLRVQQEQRIDLGVARSARGQQQVGQLTFKGNLAAVARRQALLHTFKHLVHGVELLLRLLYQHFGQADGFELCVPKLLRAQAPQQQAGGEQHCRNG